MTEQALRSNDQTAATHEAAARQCAEASRKMYDQAALRFGVNRLSGLSIDKKDLGETLFLLTAGPDIFQLVGRDSAHRAGMAAIDFGFAPVMGGIAVAQKEWATNSSGVLGKGARDTAAAASFGALETFVPAVKVPLTGLMLGGLALDQFSAANRPRNEAIANAAQQLDSRDPEVMAQSAARMQAALGKSVYDAGLVLATGAPGFKGGVAASTEIAETVRGSSLLEKISEPAHFEAMQERLQGFSRQFFGEVNSSLPREQFSNLCSVFNSRLRGIPGAEKTDLERMQDVLPVSQKLLEQLGAIESRLRINPSNKVVQGELSMLRKKIDQEHMNHMECIEDFIKLNKQNPGSVLLNSMKNSRVLGLGDIHMPNESSDARQFLITMIKDLKESGGATHFAVELPKVLQPLLDQFNSQPVGTKLSVPETLPGVSPEDIKWAARAKEELESLKTSHPEWIEMIQVARDNGLRVVCCDDNKALVRNSDRLIDAQRDRTIAASIMSVLNENPQNKVVGLFGALHLGKVSSPAVDPCAGDLLRNALGKSAVVTFLPQLGDGAAGELGSLFPFARELEAPIAISTARDKYLGNPIGALPFSRLTRQSLKFNNFDWVMMYPPSNSK